MSQWQIEGAHFGERFQLFVIIALGESVVLAGATASDTGLSVDVVAALLLAFVSSTALWWLYFGQVADTVLDRIRTATAEERGRIGRDIYTYLHLPIVAGIVLVAVGDELVIAHPTDDLPDAGALVALGGPALFLGGLMACASRLGQVPSLAWAVAVVALFAAVPLRRRRRRASRLGADHGAPRCAGGPRSVARRALRAEAGLAAARFRYGESAVTRPVRGASGGPVG